MFAVYANLVFNGDHAWTPLPVHHLPGLSHAQRRFIQLLNYANATGREVILFCRGMPGHSVAPTVYKRNIQRWPALVVRVAYALRQQFILHTNCCQPLVLANRPFLLHITPPTLRRFHHSRLINIRDMVDQFEGRIFSPTMAQVLDWHQEDYDARTGGIPPVLSNMVLQTRGQGCNDII